MQRLKTRAQFQAVLAGTTVSRTAHFALHRTGLDAQLTFPVLFDVKEPWVGALIPKRWAKRAVTRNAIKRQIYAVSTDLESTLTQAAHVVRLRSAFDRAKFPSASSDALKQAVRNELQQLFARAAQ